MQATPQNDTTPAALYIVGGTANSTDAYTGLQRYKFLQGEWETLSPTSAVGENRLFHNALYLNDSASILMYGGTQDDSSEPSSQTFTISTMPPYDVLAYESIAPPVISPLLLPWNSGQAVMLGGSDTNTKVMVFGPDTAWIDSGTTLAEPLSSDSGTKAVTIIADDGSKHLYTFDMTTSPNTVNRTVLVDGSGNPVSESRAIQSRSVGEALLGKWRGKHRRDGLTAANWPAYNGTLAPSATRDGYSLAMNGSGLVVISGGSSADVLCMFNADKNSWVNATAVLTDPSERHSLMDPASGTTSSSSTSSSASTPISTISQAASASDNDAASKALTLKILGIVLGTIAGIAFVVILVLALLRWRRRKQLFDEAGHQRRASGVPGDGEKDPVEFSDLSPRSNIPRHGQQESQSSFSSMAILMGKVNTPHRGMLGRRHGSNGSAASSAFNKKYKTAISNPIPQDTLDSRETFGDEKSPSFTVGPVAAAIATAPAPTSAAVPRPRSSANARRGSTRRSSGWNRYWSGGSALNILGFGGSKRGSGSDRNSGSQYSEAEAPASSMHNPVVMAQPALPPALRLSPPPPVQGLLQRVASGSPTISHSEIDFPLQEGMTGQIERQPSVSSVSTYDGRRDAFSSGIPESVADHESWTPIGGIQHWGVPQNGRVSSMAYSESNYAGSISGNQPHNSTAQDFSRPSGPHPLQTQQRAQNPSDLSWLNLGGSDGKK